MASTMKFNKKVYVIPEDKYTSMVKNRELRDGVETERGSVRSRSPPAHPSKAQDESRRTLSSAADEMSGAPKTHSPESGKALRGADKKTANDKSGKHAHDGHGDYGGPDGPGDPGGPEHTENVGHEKVRQGKGDKVDRHMRDAGKTKMTSPRASQEDMVRRTLFTLLKPQKRSNLMKVYAGLFSNSNSNNKNPGSTKPAKSAKSAKALAIPGLPSRDLFLALLHTQCERSARPDNYKPLYSRLLLNKVPLTYIGNKRLRRVLQYLKNRHSRRTGSVESSHPTTPSEMMQQSRLKGSKKLKNDKGREKQHALKINNDRQRGRTMTDSQRTRRGFKDPWIRI